MLERALRLGPRDPFRAEWQYRLALVHFGAGIRAGMSEISAFFEGKFKTPRRLERIVTWPIGARPTATSTLQELPMNRAIYFVGAVVAFVSVFLMQSVGGIQLPAASVSSPFAAPNAAGAAAPDVRSQAIDDLAAWPAAAGR